jgi:hypothetical protein
VLIASMGVPSGGVGLPHFDERVPHRPAVAVENPPGDDDAFAQRFTGMLTSEIVVQGADLVLAEDGTGELRQPVGQKN